MRFTSSVAAFTALLACNAHLAAASVAYVLTYEPETAEDKHKISFSSLSPSTARLVLAQRIGLEDYHSTHGLTVEEIDAINKYGASTTLFDGQNTQKRALLLAPLDAAGQSNPNLRMTSKTTVANVPSFEDTVDLWSDLLQQANPSISDASAYLHDADTFHSLSSNTPWLHVSSHAGTLIELARKLAKEQVSVTALLVPEGERIASWGSYEMPRAASLLSRQVPHRIEELPLSIGVQDGASAPSIHITASNSSSNYSNNRPLEGILPACYTSQKTCESRTRGCTGHGKCNLKYTNADAKNHPECWSCSCNATISNGLTTYWTGPACQKKDISVEFWLIALFTVGLVSLVGFAVGTIWNMGEEQLPSVIGAGVSGPTARK